MILWSITVIPNYAQEIIIDYDGNSYGTVKIGGQLWMTENLRVAHYNNGADIPSFCYDHDSANGIQYGRYYPWASIVGGMNSDSLLNICPENWHIPSNEEWKLLLDSLGGPVYAGVKLRNDDIGFNIQWGGNYQSELDIFSFIDRKAYFWSSTEYSNSAAWMVMTGINNKNINRSTVPKEFSFSVRCISNQ